MQTSSIAFAAGPIIIDHNCTDISLIPIQWINQAKNDLHIAYQHTSHGSQLVTGMNALRSFPSFGTAYDWDDSGSRPGALDLDDYGIPGSISMAKKLDSNELVSFRELLISNTIQLDVVTRLFIEKGIIIEEEIAAKLKQVQSEYQKDDH